MLEDKLDAADTRIDTLEADLKKEREERAVEVQSLKEDAKIWKNFGFKWQVQAGPTGKKNTMRRATCFFATQLLEKLHGRIQFR